MRYAIYNALEFPRHLVQQSLELHECPHNGFYDRHDVRCHVCEHSLECEWLSQDTRFSMSRFKPISELVSTLETAIFHVDAKLANNDHDSTICPCEACNWLRQAEHLFESANEARLRC